MSDGFFFNLGKQAGGHARKALWYWDSVTGSKADAIRAEYAVGQDLAEEIRAQNAIPASTEDQSLIQELGKRLTPHVAEKNHRFHFEVGPGHEANAFALPGGFIFVTPALMDLCGRQPDELAFVLGHEMGHVIFGHAMERIATSAAINMASKAMPLRGVLGGWLKNAGLKVLQSAYSQKNELAADALGQALMHAAGFDRIAADRLLERLEALAPTLDPIGAYLSTHPTTALRIANLSKRRR